MSLCRSLKIIQVAHSVTGSQIEAAGTRLNLRDTLPHRGAVKPSFYASFRTPGFRNLMPAAGLVEADAWSIRGQVVSATLRSNWVGKVTSLVVVLASA